MRARRLVVAAIVLTLAIAPVSAQQPAPAETFESLRTSGFADIYNLDYPSARSKFERMVQLDSGHPAGYFYIATTDWLSVLSSMRRLQIGLYNSDAFYAGQDDTVDPQLDRQFRADVQKAIDVAQARVTKNKNDTEALYYLGAAYGVRASYTASTMRKFKDALRDGTRGVDYHRKVVEIDPNYVDAYLSIGMYDYIVGTLPWPVKMVLAVGGVKGNRKRGLDQLRLVAEKGRYANDDARTILVALYEREGNWTEALTILDELSARYPRNYLVRLERAVVLSRSGRRAESYDGFAKVLEDKRTQPVADLVRYQFGLVLLDGSEFARAAEQFAAVAAMPGADPGLVTLARLRRGQALDATDRREAALAEYAFVLKRPDVLGSQALAKKYQAKPFKPTPAPQ